MPIWYMRPIVILSIALGLSLLINVAFLYFTGRAAGKNSNQAQIESLQASLAAVNMSQAVSKALAERAESDRKAEIDALDRIVENAKETRIIYRTAVKNAPIDGANCAPGAERQAAVNKTLGPAEDKL
jgi:hypothetical protein